MTRLPMLVAALLLASPAAAQAPDWNRARRVEVTLSSFDFAPAEIRLRAGEPVVLHLVNASDGGHNFAAKALFETATIRDESRGSIRNGAVEVASRGTTDIALIPRAGRYKLKCTHAFHTTFGMKGNIIVD